MDNVEVLGFRIIKESLKSVNGQSKTLINTISPNSYGLAQKDPKMLNALRGSDYLVLDGVYFGLAALLLKGKLIKRITGWDCFVEFSNMANQHSWRVFFLGSSNQTLAKIKHRYSQEYPNTRVESFSPPFKPVFTADDNQIIIDKINNFKPHVLFIGMTAPKQEKWGFEHKPFLDAKIISTIGNVFDWYAGNSQRPAMIWQKIGLEWLVRIFHRPEIFKRNIVNQLTFFRDLFLYILKLKRI
jgi:N-acetylglucosaminyldiphosphoundecaprenol N-acetyl-beta-D-mannosaminyltransferase